MTVGCQEQSVEPGADERIARLPRDFVGGESCAGCHEREAELWRGSHHDLAMQEATGETVLGDFGDAEFTYAGITSRFFERDGAFYVETDGRDGALAEFEIAYTFGVEPLQQYLIEFPDGRLQALSLCWDARPAEEGGQRWFHLYGDDEIPHDDALHWTGPQQNWNFMCAECHSTNLRKNYDPASDRYATTWSEIDVSCEACHGPGSRHVAWAEAAERGEELAVADLGLGVALKDGDAAAWVFDADAGIARRSVPRSSQAQLETCARCHSRRSAIAPDYAYGRPLADTHRPALIAEGLYHADGQILDEVYVYGSFLQSRMHAAGVTCSDCHDPHSARLTRGEADAACARCHLPDRFDTPEHHFHEEASAGASCVECHMPSRTYMQVDRRRDHSFRIPRPELSVELGTPNACNNCHADRDARWAAAAVERWYGPSRRPAPAYPAALDAAWKGAADADGRLIGVVGDTEAPAIARASAVALIGSSSGAASLAPLQSALRDDDPLVRAAALSNLGALPVEPRLELGAPLLTDPVRLVRQTAARALASVPPEAMGSVERANLAAAVEEYRLALLHEADRPEGRANLGALEASLGDLDAAERAFRSALELDPSFLPAHVNLVDLYRVQQRDAEGEAVLREAIAGAPDAATLRHALGLLLVRKGRNLEAVEELARAAELAPEEPRFAYVYGVALHSAGDTDRGLAVLDAAHRASPGNPQLLHALATISRDSGASERALGYARKLLELAPGDPGARQLVAQLESLPGGAAY